MKRNTVAAVVGRWQLVHLGQEALLREALSVAERVVVVLGSSFKARDPRNPFLHTEREQMLSAALSPEERARISFVPVRDYYDDRRWNAAVDRGVAAAAGPDAEVVLVGHLKDHTSYYLNNFPRWRQHRVERLADVDATAMRRVYFEADDPDAAVQVMAPYVSAPVRAWLQAWSRLPEYRRRVAEHASAQAYLKKYTAVSYMTGDALVTVGDHVLLVRRKGPFGEDLWAIPGGHLERGEKLVACAIRELQEETRFPLMAASVLAALSDVATFEDPLRSARGRLITLAHHFKFSEMPTLPEVLGSDDVKEARWFHRDELSAMEGVMFEDHFVILDHFLGVIDEAP
ncbi:NUDIX domain-containing protein [Roseateles amylovorans]|uniref:NUDIX domain-containing protein n=1 Tax=Roseateles amylovorans TaxID=2978473 RepID=A0ABY6B2V0_9BURK|nr:NUDIX domain-containing protein [Roseateles amylovorans]UXH79406.1 NUDIX domain-containing protein [Roseateles amylovorans]